MKSRNVQLSLNRFRSPTKDESFSLDVLTLDLVNYMAEEPNAQYVIGVGTDSQIYADRIVFATAIFIHRVGLGGRYFYNRTSVKAIMSLRERMHQEANLSLTISEKLLEALRSVIENLELMKYSFEIHVDIGTNGDTRVVVNEIIGWLTSCGYIVKYKPDAPCASAIADKHT